MFAPRPAPATRFVPFTTGFLEALPPSSVACASSSLHRHSDRVAMRIREGVRTALISCCARISGCAVEKTRFRGDSGDSWTAKILKKGSDDLARRREVAKSLRHSEAQFGVSSEPAGTGRRNRRRVLAGGQGPRSGRREIAMRLRGNQARTLHSYWRARRRSDRVPVDRAGHRQPSVSDRRLAHSFCASGPRGCTSTTSSKIRSA